MGEGKPNVSLRKKRKIGNGERRECLAEKEKEGEGKTKEEREKERKRKKKRKWGRCFMPGIFFLIPISLTIKFSNWSPNLNLDQIF